MPAPTDPAPTATETDLIPAPTDTTIDLSDPAPTDTSAPGPGETADYAECAEPHWVNTLTHNYGRFLFAVGLEQEDHNSTSSTFLADFSETSSATVGVSFSGTFEGKVSAFIAEVKTTFNVQVSGSFTVSVGNTVHPKVLAHHTLYGKYGVFRDKVSGTSYYENMNCKHTSVHSFTGYGPVSVGWDIWQS